MSLDFSEMDKVTNKFIKERSAAILSDAQPVWHGKMPFAVDRWDFVDIDLVKGSITTVFVVPMRTATERPMRNVTPQKPKLIEEKK